MCQEVCWALRLQRCLRLCPNLVSFTKLMITTVVRHVKCAVEAEEEEFNCWEVENKRGGEMFGRRDLIWVLEDA